MQPDALACERFRCEGWYSPPGTLFSETTLREAREAMRDPFRAPDLPMPPRMLSYLGKPPNGPRTPRWNQHIAHQYQAVWRIATDQTLARIAATLVGADGVRLWNTALITKAPGESAAYASIAWHCDSAFWPTCSSKSMLTAWIPLHAVERDSGALRVLLGSHQHVRKGVLPEAALRAQFRDSGGSEAAVASEYQRAGLELRPHVVELEAGCVSFHHMDTLHCSGPNRGDASRVAISVQFQDVANEYVRHPGGASYPMEDVVDRHRSGSPDFGDPAVCPLLWSRTEEPGFCRDRAAIGPEE